MWNNVELLINEDTNTGRLCTNSGQESGSALYQVDTLVKLSSSEKAVSNPNIYAFSNPNCSIVVADTTVVLLDPSFQTVLLHLYFETLVDAVTICSEGRFLLVGERNGNFHLIYVPQNKTIITRALQQSPSNGERTTYKSLILQEGLNSPGVYNLFLVVQDGFLHISNLALGKIQRAIDSMDIGTLNEVQSLIKMDFCSTKEIHGNGCISAVLSNMGNKVHLLIGADGENVLSHWVMKPTETAMSLTNVLDSSYMPGVCKIQVVDNVMYLLDNETMLSVWDIHSFVMLCCWPDHLILDFLLITEGDTATVATQESSSMKIMALTAEDGNQGNKLLVQSLPSMDVLYSLEVSMMSCLVQKGVGMDTIYILEGISEDMKSAEGQVSALVIRCFTEALPENRLNRLLYKRKFEDAEKFAIAFELDVELVYKVKLDFVQEKLASASPGESEEALQLVEEAKTNLMKIMDEQYVVQYCLAAFWPTLGTVQEMLNYAASRFPSSPIQMALARLATYIGVHGPDRFDVFSWIEFLNSTDTLKDILRYLRQGSLSEAQHLWLRHEGEFVGEFDEGSLQALLACVPVEVPSEELRLWFKGTLVPFVCRHLPRAKRVLAKWLEQRARTLELTEKGGWPQNGLSLAELGLPSWSCMPLMEDGEGEELEQLRALVASLRQLRDLHSKYSCRLSLSDFEKGSTRSIAFLMLDKVMAPELIPSVIDSSVRPYALENRLDLNQTLLHYIKDLLECISTRTTTLFSEWEAKAVAILHCMTDTNLVMDAVLEIMQMAVVPWSDVVEKLVQQHLEKEHPKQELLRETYRLMEMKKLLRRYGIRGITLSITSIKMLLRHILKQDQATSLEDALNLADACKVDRCETQYLYSVQLLDQGKREKCVTLLKALPPAEAEVVVKRLATWARIYLQSKEQEPELRKQQMLVAQVMVEALKFLQSVLRDDAFTRVVCEDSLRMFMAIAHLQEYFDIFLTPDEYDDPVVRRQFHRQLITAYENARAWRGAGKRGAGAEPEGGGAKAAVAKDPDGKTKSLSAEVGLHRLARQLLRTEEELWGDLALRALDAGNAEKALDILGELSQYYPNAATGRALFGAAQRLCLMLEDNVPMVLPAGVDLPTRVYTLACQAVTICHPDLLLDCMELCKSTRAAANVYRQCQIDDSGFVAKESPHGGDEDAYSEAIVHEVFNEDGIVLDPVSVLPVQYKITTCLLPLPSETKLYSLDCSCLSNCAFVEGTDFVKPLLQPISTLLQSLQECSQLELALRLLLDSYGSILQHFLSNNMDLALSTKLHDKNRLLQDKQCLSMVRKKTMSSINTVVVSLLQKVLNWRVVDRDLAVGLCTMLSKAEVLSILWKTISNAWQNYEKITAVAMVGAHLCSLYKEEQERKKFLAVITDAEWGIKLAKFGVSIQAVFRQCPETKRNLIPTLVTNRSVTPQLILEYCSTFDLDGDSAINLYITTLLLQEEEEGPAGGAGGEEGAEPLAQEHILERVVQIIPQLGSKSDLVISLNAALAKLNPYNYERIEMVLKTIQIADECTNILPLSQMMSLVQHLKSHRRISPPTDLESTYLLENSLESTSLSNTRLPVHLLQNNHCFWKIIRPELSEETFPTLLLISKLMKVSLDKLHMSMVNHVYERSLKPLLLEQAKRGQTHGSTKEAEALVQSVYKYTHCIQNLELAAATIHRIAQELPPGTEKTTFIKFCLELGHKMLTSQSLEEEVRGRGEILISKLQLQYQRSATENALASHGLGTAELLKLTGLPGRLLVALFEHSTVEERMRKPALHAYPDIHSAAKDIASINSACLLKVRNILLEKWICKTGQSSGKDMNQQDCFTDIQDDPDIMRVVYLLQMHPMDMSARLLCHILTAETWPLEGSGLRLTFQHRSRVLLCLIHIADPATIKALSNIPPEKVRDYLKCYVYLSQLEALNIPYTLDMFLNSPKEGMIKGLWKNHSNEPQAVRLVADLSLEYQLYDPQLWNGVLQKLLVFNMTSFLQKVLVSLCAVPSLLEMSSFSRTWRSVILSPFMAASVPLSPQQQTTFYQTFVLLLKCPFLLSLDLLGIAKRFAQLNLLALSVGTLLLIPCSKKRQQQIQCVLAACNPTLILDQLEEHMDTGELGGSPTQIRDAVLEFCCQTGQHQNLVKTQHFHRLRKYMASNALPSQVEEMINYLVDHSSEGEAISFAQECMKWREQKGGERSSNVITPDPVKEFLARTVDFHGRRQDM